MDVRKVKIGTKLLEVKLTDEQRIELGVELDAHYEERKILDKDLADLKTAEKAKKAEIEIENHLHFDQNVVKVVRLDTLETIQDRPMTTEERQLEMGVK